MEKELVIHSSSDEVKIAYLEDEKLVEYHSQESENDFVVGDIFLGEIKRTQPGLRAAFVDIGHEKDAFIHYTDLGPKIPSLIDYTSNVLSGKQQSELLNGYDLTKEIKKDGKINYVFKRKMKMMFQILKEPISTKGPRLTCEITIPGRLLVLVPFSNVVSISKKIGDSNERKRLRTLLESIKPTNFGIIARTQAVNKTVAPLHEEIEYLMGKWKTVYENLKSKPCPAKLLDEEGKTHTFLRDLFDDNFQKITVDDKQLYSNIENYMTDNIPEKKKIVNYYSGKRPIFDQLGVTRQIKSAFGKTITMPSGAYLVIEHTEAMHVIDVNSGPKVSRGKGDIIYKVNLEAAKEIARQLRLRDIGGLIIIDFIDMKDKSQRKELFYAMKEFMKEDRAQHTILPLSNFGLMQITRQRVKPEIIIKTSEVCPTCKGTGKTSPTLLVTDEIENSLADYLRSHPKAKITIEVHPFVYAYLTKGFLNSVKKEWSKKYKTKLKIIQSSEMPITSYTFYNEHGDQIRL